MGGFHRRLVLVGGNFALPLAVLCFASGFFPYKPFIAGRNEFSDVDYAQRPEPVFDRVVLMVVDALRRSQA